MRDMVNEGLAGAAASRIAPLPMADRGRSRRVASSTIVSYRRRMDIIEDEAAARLARRLRLEREMRGWSLADLAECSGVSKAAISKIERQEASPTAALLVRLAAAFDLTLAGLLIRAEGGDERLIRAEAQPLWRDPATGYVRRQIHARADHPVELVEVTMPAGGRVALPAASYVRIRQIVWVTAGRLRLSEGGTAHDLGPGDCLSLGPPADVVFENLGPEPATYVVALARA
jgi:transcriptional regulator with XRE-family HTH domain